VGRPTVERHPGPNPRPEREGRSGRIRSADSRRLRGPRRRHRGGRI